MERFYLCDCYSHALEVSDGLVEEGLISIAFWRCGYCERGRFLEPLRAIWHIIRYGHPYTDEFLLSSKTARELSEHLMMMSHKLDMIQEA